MHKCGARAKVYKNGAGGLSSVVFQKKKNLKKYQRNIAQTEYIVLTIITH